MAKQALIIGLGEFGLAMARALTERGVEVIAVDNDEAHLKLVAETVDEAICLDATDEKALEQLAPGRRDMAICAIGDDSRESSIICTALLRQMGCEKVVSRANDRTHARILRLVGAHEVINPEEEFATWYASQLSHAVILGEFGLGGGLVLTELKAPKSFLNKSLRELELPNRYKVTLVAVRRVSSPEIILPSPQLTFEEDDTLVVVSRTGKVDELIEDHA